MISSLGGIPTYNCLVALVDYLDPKVGAMRAWKGSNSSSAEKQYASVANQLFSVLIRLQLALLPLMSVEDSSNLQLHIHYVHCYVCCLKSFVRCFHFYHVSKFHSRCLEGLRNIFLTLAMKSNVNSHLDF